MNIAELGGFLYLLLLFPPLIYLQRFLQREIQSIFLLITRQADISTALFSLLFLPGVLLHETSHYLMAHLLGVKTGRFSLIPKKVEDGRLQLGYVETAKTDFVRDALIGAAPLIAGCTAVALIGTFRLEINALWESYLQGGFSSLRGALEALFAQPDFWLWFYLTFTVSSTMMPSPADRKAWLPFLALIAAGIGLVLLLGVGPWIMSHFGNFIASALEAITIVFGITILIHLVLLPPLWVIRKIISRMVGYQVV